MVNYKVVYLHALVLIGSLLSFPYLNVLLPWIYWVTRKDKRGEMAVHACNVLNFKLLVSTVFYVSMFVMWYCFIHRMADGGTPQYIWMILPISIFLVFSILYPLYIVIYMGITKKAKIFYPNLIRIFK